MANIYLAGPLFTEHEKAIVRQYAGMLRAQGHNVYVPMEHSIPDAWSYSNHEWAKKVFDEDIRAIDRSDRMVVLYYGLYSDSGTAWEAGYAYAKGKCVEVVDCGCAEASLMVVNGQSANRVHLFYDVAQT